MSRGRPRLLPENFPAHVDVRKVPKGCYWDARGAHWYTIHTDPKPRRQRIAESKATLADLHRVMEDIAGVERGTIGWLLDLFHASETFRNLAQQTQDGYEKQARIARARKTKAGLLGTLILARLTRPAMQTLIDTIAAEGTPTKANHLLRYLRRVCHWGMNRGHCAHNPFSGIEQAKERKHRTVPSTGVREAVAVFASKRGAAVAHSSGSAAPYLWPAMEIAYRCRLRGIEVVTLSDDNILPDGLRSNRVKGSRDNITAWSPTLRAAVDAALALRSRTWDRLRRPVPLRAADRFLFVNDQGSPLKKGTFDSAWQAMMLAAIKAGVIAKTQRFGFHALKHCGITDTAGTRGEKQLASGHKAERMLDTYDHSVPVVKPAGSES